MDIDPSVLCYLQIAKKMVLIFIRNYYKLFYKMRWNIWCNLHLYLFIGKFPNGKSLREMLLKDENEIYI